MSVSWLVQGGIEPRAHGTLAGLVKSIVDADILNEGLQGVLDLAGRLILSNHLHEASELLCAAYSLAAKTDNDRFTPGRALSFQVFWNTHPELKRPDATPDFPAAVVEHERWGKYRECTRTGWMKDSYGIAKPQDPSVWRETEDPIVIALCARLLAKTVVPETYPPPEKMREALDAILKLYAQPELPQADWLAMKPWLNPPYAERPRTYEYMLQDQARLGAIRHTSLVYRRLAVELALRLGEFQTAADVLSKALTKDGLSYDGSIVQYLMLPGIYDALPLLAEGGKESNMFYIPKEDAKVIETEVLAALKLRSEEGRQWELAEHRVGWEELLNRLAEAAWKTHRKEYRFEGCRSAQDILYDPATEEEIQQAEEEVGELPPDLKAMVRVANGFKGGHHLFGGGIAGIQNIMNCEAPWDLINFASAFDDVGLRQDGNITGTMIELEVGAESDGFRHYMIPPAIWKANVLGREVADGEYQYWNTAAWRVGLSRYSSIRDYVASCVEEVEAMAARGEVADFDLEDFEDEDEDASSESS